MIKLKNLFVVILSSVLFLCDNGFSMEPKLQAGNLWAWATGPDDRMLGRYCKTYLGEAGGEDIWIGKTHGPKQDPEYDDEYGVMLMVARETSVGGAKFCPMAINAQNKDRGDYTWTYYHDLPGPCVWLCRRGFTGENCTQRDTETITSCDTTMLAKTNYSGLRLPSRASASNVENAVPNFDANVIHDCGHEGYDRTEHDWILVITGWLSSGRGVWVRPYEIRARWLNGDDTQVEAYPALNSRSVLACKNGYKPNAENTDCVAINPIVCAETTLCPNWNGENFSTNEHLAVAVGSCLQWRCKDPDKGLKKAGSSECINVEKTLQSCVNSNTGVVVSCETGMICNSQTGGCDNPHTNPGYRIFTKERLLYGDGTANSPLELQCWTISDSYKYAECVMAGISD